MTNPADISVRDLGSMQLRLRGDLTFTPQSAMGQPYYLIEDRLSSRFFRLGLVEYQFVSLLDGQRSIQDALRALATALPHHHLTEHDAAGLCRWLVEMDLAHTEESSQGGSLARSAATARDRKSLTLLNPLMVRVPLGRPDRLLAQLTDWFGWIHSPPAMAAWLLLVAAGAYAVLGDWSRFVDSSNIIFVPHNWLWLTTCWVVLKALHEASHGIACRRHGGTVREAGVLLVLCAPLAYVDVTSSWRFRSRLARIQVAAAGMYVELAVAAAAALIWSQTEPGWLNHLCATAVFTVGVATLVFNANPLMKFDGYYILSDALALPNLYASGQQYLRYWSKRYLLGLRTAMPAWSRREALLIRLYGVASLAWRAVVSVSLVITATTLLHGAGVVLAGVALVLWLGLPTIAFVRYLLNGKTGERPRRLQFCLTAGSAAALSTAVLTLVPWPGASRAPAVVEYSPHTIVRAASDGFVASIHVNSGELVRQDQVLVVLENRELAREVADLELQIRQSTIRGQRHEQKGELAQQQAEARNGEALQTQLAERRAQLEQLTLKAPRPGRIVGRNLDALPGAYLEEGTEVLTIGDESQKELRVSLSQDDLEAIHSMAGAAVDIDVPRLPLWQAPVSTVIPRASLTPAHPALAAVNGGPLSVKPTARDDEDTPRETHELLTPRFTAIVPLTAADSRSVHSGQLATIAYRPCHESIGAHLYFALSRWIEARLVAGTAEQ